MKMTKKEQKQYKLLVQSLHIMIQAAMKNDREKYNEAIDTIRNNVKLEEV